MHARPCGVSWRMDGPPAGQAGTIELAPGLPVHRLGFGAMRLPGIWGDPELIEDSHRLLRRAVDLGVTFIDRAHAYGVSEQRIGEGLFPYPADLVVATKAGLGRGSDGRPETLRAHVDQSLERLRRERIDLLQLHTVDPSVPIEESVGPWNVQKVDELRSRPAWLRVLTEAKRAGQR